MGWFYCDAADHEGYLVGFTHRAPGCGELLRELCYPVDDNKSGVPPVLAVSAGCECGWRSPRWKPRQTLTWHPFSLALNDDNPDEEKARRLWAEHMRGYSADARANHKRKET